MYRIIDGRATGKTSRLMLLARESGATIACSNPAAMRVKAEAYGLTGIEFISYAQLADDNKVRGLTKDVLIDELEGFLAYTLGKNVKLLGYSLSDED